MNFGLMRSPISFRLVSDTDATIFLEVENYAATDTELNTWYDGLKQTINGKLKHIKDADGNERYLIVEISNTEAEEETDIADAFDDAENLHEGETSEDIYTITGGHLSLEFPRYCIIAETIEVEVGSEESTKTTYTLHKLADAFHDFEPYMFGEECTPDAGQYEPMGELDKDITKCYQVLSPADPFCKKKELFNYRTFYKASDGDPIIGIEKGTAPKCQQYFWSKENDSLDDTIEIKINGDENGIHIDDGSGTGINITLDMFKARGYNFVPKRIGVLLVGSGGGSSGSTCSDLDQGSNCAHTEHIIAAGTGGGGGAVAACVVNLENTNNDRYIIIKLGKRGKCGESADVTTGDNNYNEGKGGGTGGTSTIELYDAKFSSEVKTRILVNVGGGQGGEKIVIPKKTEWELIEAVGGLGGEVENEYTALMEKLAASKDETAPNDIAILKDVFWLVQGKAGGQGRGYTAGEDLAVATTEDFEMNIMFLNDETEDERYTRKIKQTGKKGKLPERIHKAGTDDTGNYYTARVPGGNSYGAGGYASMTEEGELKNDHAAEIGGGGLYTRIKAEGEDNGKKDNVRNGGNSFVALFY